MNVETGKLTYFDFDGEDRTRCFDYGILDDNRFILVCGPPSDTFYQLRLYNLSNFKLLDTYSIITKASKLEIYTNPNFNLTFILQILNYYEGNPLQLLFFRVVNNRITMSNTNLTNFKIITDCLNYLVGFFGDEPYHSFINVNNLQVVKKTPRYDIYSRIFRYGPRDYFVQENILTICNG